jgi:hypothetical protein
LIFGLARTSVPTIGSALVVGDVVVVVGIGVDFSESVIGSFDFAPFSKFDGGSVMAFDAVGFFGDVNVCSFVSDPYFTPSSVRPPNIMLVVFAPSSNLTDRLDFSTVNKAEGATLFLLSSGG